MGSDERHFNVSLVVKPLNKLTPFWKRRAQSFLCFSPPPPPRSPSPPLPFFLSLPVEPSSPNPGCPSGYIRDGFPLSCTCSLSTPGTPAARPVWSHDSAGGASFTKTVTSQDNGDNFTCQAKWGDRVIKQTSYTLRVACELFVCFLWVVSLIAASEFLWFKSYTLRRTTHVRSVPMLFWNHCLS